MIHFSSIRSPNLFIFVKLACQQIRLHRPGLNDTQLSRFNFQSLTRGTDWSQGLRCEFSMSNEKYLK
jgi:hypothetical protein